MFTGVMWRLVVWCAKWEAEVRPGEIRTRGEDPRRGRSIGEGEGWGRRVTKKNIIKICSRDRKARAHANIAVRQAWQSQTQRLQNPHSSPHLLLSAIVPEIRMDESLMRRARFRLPRRCREN